MGERCGFLYPGGGGFCDELAVAVVAFRDGWERLVCRDHRDLHVEYGDEVRDLPAQFPGEGSR